jgi:hypothetical protein
MVKLNFTNSCAFAQATQIIIINTVIDFFSILIS